MVTTFPSLRRALCGVLTISLLATAPMRLAAAEAAEAPRPEAASKAAEKQAEAPKPIVLDDVVVYGVAGAGAASAVLSREQITRQAGSDGDLNKLLQTQPNVQFSDSDARISMASIVDLRPSLVSISGGRPYDNNFRVDGLSTNSVMDSSNQNIHATDDVVGHPQTVVLNPKLVDTLTVYTNDIPAEFGGFTGGVVSAKTRDPVARLGGGFSVGYEDSDMANYHIAPVNLGSANPAEPVFERKTGDAWFNLPVGQDTAVLLSWSRREALLKNTVRFATFGRFDAESRTLSDNVFLKAVHTLSDTTKLRFTSLWSPYETENREQDLKTTSSDSFTNKVEFEHTTAAYTLEGSVAGILADNSRGSENSLYTYRNFGAGDQVDWVEDAQTTGLRGGIGSLDSKQTDVPVTLKFSYRPTATGVFSAGADYVYTQAEVSRPNEANAYRHQTTVGLVLNPLVRSGDGAADRTVLSGEQALNYRLSYAAYDAKAELQSTDVWAQWEDRGKLGAMNWSYRAGVRYDYNDFLGNHDVAPRFSASFSPLTWLTFNGGANRYYSKPAVSYQLRDARPDTLIYTRTGRSEGGNLVFYNADWRLNSVTRSARYGTAGLDTPHSDELSLGTTLGLGRYGNVILTGLERRNRDEFARSASGTIIINGVSYTSYRMTNLGATDYRSVSLQWNKAWRNHTFTLSSTLSETESNTEEVLDEAEPGAENETVHYNGLLLRRSALNLIRTNFARPSYVNASWTSRWFSNRLSVDVFGRWLPSYDRIDASGSLLISGTRYDNYVDTDVPATFITNVNLSWQAVKARWGTLTLETRVSNALDRLPYAEGATPAAPYQEGRAIWIGASYEF